jgi:hypothetical protein
MSKKNTQTNTLSAAKKIAQEVEKLSTNNITAAEFAQSMQNTILSVKDKHLRSAQDINRLYSQINDNIDLSGYDLKKQSEIKEILLQNQLSNLQTAHKKAGTEGQPELKSSIRQVLTDIVSIKKPALQNQETVPAIEVLAKANDDLNKISSSQQISDADKIAIQETVASNSELQSSFDHPAKEVLTQASQNIKSLFEQVTGKENLGHMVGMKDSIFKKITSKEDLGKLVGIKESVFTTITGKKHLGEVLDKTGKMLEKAAASCKEGVTLAQAHISKTIIEPSKKKFTELTTRKNQNIRQ